MGLELPLCIVVTLSKNAITCFLELSIRPFCFISRPTVHTVARI